MRVKGTNYLLYNYFAIICVSLTLLSALFLSYSQAFANENIDDVSISIPSACTMSGSGMNSHTAEIPNGTYRH